MNTSQTPTDPSSKPSPIGQALRSEIERRSLTAYQIAKGAGVSVDAVHRFVKGQRGLSLTTVDAVANYLGMTLVVADQAPEQGQPLTA